MVELTLVMISLIVAVCVVGLTVFTFWGILLSTIFATGVPMPTDEPTSGTPLMTEPQGGIN